MILKSLVLAGYLGGGFYLISIYWRRRRENFAHYQLESKPVFFGALSVMAVLAAAFLAAGGAQLYKEARLGYPELFGLEVRVGKVVATGPEDRSGGKYKSCRQRLEVQVAGVATPLNLSKPCQYSSIGDQLLIVVDPREGRALGTTGDNSELLGWLVGLLLLGIGFFCGLFMSCRIVARLQKRGLAAPK